MFRILLIFLLTITVPQALVAGPWPREKGHTFLSFSTTVTTPQSNVGDEIATYSAIYLEHGLKRILTFGLDGGIDELGNYFAVAFVRKPVIQSARNNRFALTVGIGSKGNADASDILLSGGTSWGRGFETGWGPSWTTLDFQVQYTVSDADVATKADFTFGVKPNKNIKLMLQIQSGKYPDADPYVRLAPSVALAIGSKRHLEIGGQFGLVGDEMLGLKVGTWMEF